MFSTISVALWFVVLVDPGLFVSSFTPSSSLVSKDHHFRSSTQSTLVDNALNSISVIPSHCPRESLIRLWSKNTKKQEDDNKKDPRMTFYINIHVLDKKAVVKSAVQSSRFVPKWMQGFASSVGAKVLSDEEIIGEITDEIITSFPDELLESGVTTKFELCFSKGIFAVLKCTVLDLDIRTVLKTEMGDEAIVQYQNILSAMKYFEMSEEEVEEVSNDIENEVLDSFPLEIETEMKEEFAKEGIRCEVSCKREEEEANYLFDYMSKIL